MAATHDDEFSDEEQMLLELVERFVEDRLMPLERDVLAREAAGGPLELTEDEERPLLELCRELGLWALDAPAEMGGAALPARVMLAIHERLARTITPFQFPPDSPNLHMLDAVASPEQRVKYLEPYALGRAKSAMAISEPDAGSDPAAMRTRAVRDGDHWVINGRKIWVSRVPSADFTILMAVTDPALGARGGMTAFLVDRDTPGFVVEREIPMLGGNRTYELRIEDLRLHERQVLGEVGQGFAPMQKRLTVRRLEIGARGVGMASRALAMMCRHVQEREVFGQKLADRQAIQWWIADAATKIHLTRLLVRDAARKADRGEDIRTEASMVKVYATEMAAEVVDHAMQSFGALGMTREMPFAVLSQRLRMSRVYEGPSEVHRMVVARRVIADYARRA
jgi:acyl-CoA dehydrogenase